MDLKKKTNSDSVNELARSANFYTSSNQNELEVHMTIDHSNLEDLKKQYPDSEFIKLSKGLHTIVDIEDFEHFSQFKWHITDKGYARRNCYKLGRYNPKSITIHRSVTNAKDGEFVDHINRNPLDNRKANLRICTKRENCRNSGKKPTNKSGFKGVSWNYQQKKWGATMMFNGKTKNLGFFKDPMQAAMVYDIWAMLHHGEFAVTNKSLNLLK